MHGLVSTQAKVGSLGMSQRHRRLYGRAVAILCGREGYSKKGLAEYLRVDVSYVSHICSGKIYPLKYLDDIPEYLNVTHARLLMSDPLAGIDDAQPAREPTPEEALRRLAKLAELTVSFGKMARGAIKKP